MATNSNSYTYSDTGFSAEVKVGTIIAWDTTAKQYIPAEARCSNSITRADGSLAPADSAYIVGVVTDLESGTGTILTSGIIDDTALIAAILENENPAAGQYYLGTGGKLIHADAGGRALNLPIHCCTYTGPKGKLIFNPKAPEHYGHSHSRYTLEKLEAVTANEAPAGMGYKFVPSSEDVELKELIENYGTTCLLAKNGTIIADDDWKISNGVLFTKFNLLPGDSLVLYGIYPTFGYDPLVHSVSVNSDYKLLSVANNSGNVELRLNTETTPVAGNGTAIIGIDPINGIQVGEVVHGIVAGPGINVSGNSGAPGVVIISNSQQLSSHIDMQVTNLNGALFGTSDNGNSYTLPAATECSISGVFRLPEFSKGVTLVGNINLLVRGTGEAIDGSSIEASCTLFESPQDDISGAISRLQPRKFNDSTIAIGVDNTCVLKLPELNCLTGLKPNMLVQCKLSASNLSKNIEVIAISLTLHTV